MARILILYSTTDGHTRAICQRLESRIGQGAHQVTLASLTDTPVPDPATFDTVVIGASIRYGRHSPRVRAFIDANASVLDVRPNAFFSVNLVARKPGKNTPEGNAYLQRFLKQIAWKPRHLAVFAGRLDYPRYGTLDRIIIRLIMRITGGPTAPDTVVEYTDWDQVDRFARLISDL